jgi:hypothetical protein
MGVLRRLHFATTVAAMLAAQGADECAIAHTHVTHGGLQLPTLQLPTLQLPTLQVAAAAASGLPDQVLQRA